MRRVLAILLAVALAAALSASHVAHAGASVAPDASQHETRQHAAHGHAHQAPEERAGHKAALCCFFEEPTTVAPRSFAVRAAPAASSRPLSSGLARAPNPPPPRSI